MSDPIPHPTFVAPEVAKLAPHFPGYDIEVLIATGGMGAVYRAVQKSLDRKVAIKILPHEFSKDAAFCAGFEAEAKAMARLNHPNLIGVYDFGEVDGMLFIIMEYVPGKSLFHSSHATAIDPSEAIRLVTGICHGLAHAHENGILHRDIKPSNILLDLNAQPKIGDFGLARPIETKVQEGEEIFGTPHYTAPEVVNAPQSVDYRADIFSVGVLLHELLTGKLPADDRRPASAIAHCDPRFDVIIRRATHPLPEARFGSATEIANELQIIAASAGPRILKTAASATAVNPRGPKRAPALGKPPVGKPIVSNSSSNVPVIVTLVIGVILAGILLLYMGNQGTGTLNSAETSSPTPNHPKVETGNQSVPAPPVTKPSFPRKPETDKELGQQVQIPVRDQPMDDAFDSEETDEEAIAKNDDKDIEDPPAKPPVEEEKVSTFDIDGFFARARVLMKDRAAPIIAASNEKFAKNLQNFERGAKRFVRRMDRGDSRDDAEEALDELMETAIEERHRIPKKLPGDLAGVDELDDLHEECLEIQDELDLSLMNNLKQLSSLYVVGLEKQIERLDAEIDAKPIGLIKSEIDKTKDNETYFPHLMLGIEELTEDKDAPTSTKKPLLE